MTTEPRRPLDANMIRKGEGAIAERQPMANRAVAPKEPFVATTIRMKLSTSEKLRNYSFKSRRKQGDIIDAAVAEYLERMS